MIFSRSSQRRNHRLRIHQGEGRTPVPVTVQAQIIDATDRTVFQDRTTFARLSAGRYLLRMTVEAARTTTDRWVRFQLK